MAKAKKRRSGKAAPAPKKPVQTVSRSLLNQLEQPRNILIFFGILFLFIIWLYKPVVIDGLDVQGGDVISNIGNTNQIKEFEAKTGERALWNPSMFAGTPIYHRHNPISWSLDSLIWLLDPLIDWRVWYLWLGAAGMFLLARYLGLSALTGMVAGIGFILIPHFHALIVVGHFSKLRALMWLPWVLLAFLYFLNRRSVLSMLLFTAAFALQMRTQHYQIIFYTMLLLAFAGFWPYLKLMLEKRWREFLKFNAFFAAAIGLAVLIVAQPLFVTRDYTPYSTRGGNAVSLNQEVSEQDKKGVGFDYATNWSYSTAEFWNLIIPRFHGGTSNEGIPVPRLNNQPIPAYWGELPFTQSYEYLSIILAFLALTAIFFRWDLPLVKSLTLLTILALLLSLGKNLAPLYKLFFYYLPYFDKFRVPMMILTLVSFNMVVLAAIGLQYLMREGLTTAANRKKYFMVSGALGILLLIPLFFGASFSLTAPGELERYAAQYGQGQAAQLMELFREARLGVMKASTARTLGFLVITVALLYFIGQKPRQRAYFALGLVLLVAVDLGLVSVNYLEGKFVDLQQAERQTYRLNETDRLVRQDTSLYRVFPPLRRLANDSRYTYFYQSIGGYSAAKLQVIQDLIANNLVNPADPGMPLNLPVISMLNGKYIFSNQRYRHPDLALLGSDARGELHVYRNKEVLPRAFFVEEVRVISDGAERLEYLNSPNFDPGREAVLEEPLSQPIGAPDSSAARVTHFEPNQLTVQAYTDRTALLVLSEVYYPEGWTATLESGETLPIHKTNHILRSVVVPRGEHTITLEFHPATYYTGVRLSWIGWGVVYLGLVILLYREYGQTLRRRFGGKSSRKNA